MGKDGLGSVLVAVGAGAVLGIGALAGYIGAKVQKKVNKYN